MFIFLAAVGIVIVIVIVGVIVVIVASCFIRATIAKKLPQITAHKQHHRTSTGQLMVSLLRS